MMGIHPPCERTRALMDALGNDVDGNPKHLEVGEIKRYFDLPEEATFTLRHYCNTSEVQKVRDGMAMTFQDKLLSFQFGSFLVRFAHDDELDMDIIEELWGIPTTVLWPDSFVFRLV